MNKLLIILIVTIVLVTLSVGGYFLYRHLSDDNSEEEEQIEELVEELVETEAPPKKQVFNVSDNVFNYDEARSVCKYLMVI